MLTAWIETFSGFHRIINPWLNHAGALDVELRLKALDPFAKVIVFIEKPLDFLLGKFHTFG